MGFSQLTLKDLICLMRTGCELLTGYESSTWGAQNNSFMIKYVIISDYSDPPTVFINTVSLLFSYYLETTY